MAGTYGYSGSFTYTIGSGQVANPIVITSLPGTHPTSWTVTVSPATPTLLSCALVQANGSNTGSVMLSGNIGAGGTTVTASGSVAPGTGLTQLNVRCTLNGTFTPPVAMTFAVTITYSDASPPPACAYGASPNPSAAIYTYITAALVDAVAAALGMGPLGIVALDTMIGSPILFPTCSNVPTMPTALVDADFIDGTPLPNPLSLPKWFSHFTYGVWLFYCQCNAAPSGLPAPTNPPLPTLPPRLQPGPQPAPPCSNTDTCTTLVRLEHILTNINLQITNNSYYQQEPAYTWGAIYAGISGNGEIAVSGILGVFVSFTTLPNRAGLEVGDPNFLYDVGHITFGSPDGWYPRQRITSNPWLSLPLHMANISKIGYSIPNDCTISLTLLVAVPMALSAASGT